MSAAMNRKAPISSYGFTLVEMMITLVVAAIVLGLAVPSFQTLIENNRVVTQVNEMVGAVNLARGEAIKRGINISLTSAGGFQNGWCVHDGTGCGTAGELRVFDAMNAVTVTGGVAALVFDSKGMRLTPGAGVVEVAITLAPQGCAAGEVGRARLIQIGTSGRPNVSTVNCP